MHYHVQLSNVTNGASSDLSLMMISEEFGENEINQN